MAKQTKAQLKEEIKALAEELGLDLYDSLDWRFEKIPEQLKKDVSNVHHLLQELVEHLSCDIPDLAIDGLFPDVVQDLEKGKTVDLKSSFDHRELIEAKPLLPILDVFLQSVRSFLKIPNLIINYDDVEDAYIRKPINIAHLVQLKKQLLEAKKEEDDITAKQKKEERRESEILPEKYGGRLNFLKEKGRANE